MKELITAFLLFPLVCYSQTHLSPASGADGEPGPIPKSFIISWEGVPNAIAYEYVLTDNQNCFEGCAGDTRQNKTEATVALEYDLRDKRFYYWITRIYYANGDTSGWTKVSNFFATTPPATEAVILYPNPVIDEKAFVRIDWGKDPRISEVLIQRFSFLGTGDYTPLLFRRTNPFDRFSDFSLPTGLGSGIYLFRIQLKDKQGETLGTSVRRWMVR